MTDIYLACLKYYMYIHACAQFKDVANRVVMFSIHSQWGPQHLPMGGAKANRGRGILGFVTIIHTSEC